MKSVTFTMVLSFCLISVLGCDEDVEMNGRGNGSPDADTDGDADGGADSDTDTDTDTDGDTDSDSDADGGPDADTDSDTDGDTDADTDSDSDGDTDSDSDSDTGTVGPTWVDDDSGLEWEMPVSFAMLYFDGANAYCENLDWEGYTDWRLPTISELRSLILMCEDTEPGGACNVTDDCLSLSCKNEECADNGTCNGGGGPGASGYYFPPELNCTLNEFWSSSVVDDDTTLAWTIAFFEASLYSAPVSEEGPDARTIFVRCVRDAS